MSEAHEDAQHTNTFRTPNKKIALIIAVLDIISRVIGDAWQERTERFPFSDIVEASN